MIIFVSMCGRGWGGHRGTSEGRHGNIDDEVSNAAGVYLQLWIKAVLLQGVAGIARIRGYKLSTIHYMRL